ncbi:MAG: hypothetical protein AAF958_17510 [Planctomycetota bacterium]
MLLTCVWVLAAMDGFAVGGDPQVQGVKASPDDNIFGDVEVVYQSPGQPGIGLNAQRAIPTSQRNFLRNQALRQSDRFDWFHPIHNGRLQAARFDTYGLSLPQDKKAGAGITLDAFVDCWMDPGYVVLRTRLSSTTGVSSSDQTFTLKCATGIAGSYPQDRRIVTDIAFVLPQGKQTVTDIHRIPNYSITAGIELSLFRDGQPLPEYSGIIDRTGNYTGGFRVLADWTSAQRKSPFVRWRESDLDSFEAVCRSVPTIQISAGELERFDASTREGRAVRDLVLRGGRVLVDGMGLQLFEEVRAAHLRAAIETPTEIGNAKVFEQIAEDLADPKIERTLQSLDLDSQATQVVSSRSVVSFNCLDSMFRRRVGPGQILLGEGDVNRVANSITAAGTPMLNRGVDPIIGDSRFRNWLIAGVAQPPVYTFMGLLTVFVLLVGPVAYRKSMKSGRGYLIFAIAPLLAALTTVSMFAYGIIADGFGTVARVRQITFVDGASGDAGERIKSTYFAGIRPRDGLRFDADDEVYPTFYDEKRTWESIGVAASDTVGTVRFEGGDQIFSADFLPSRQQRQFVVLRNRRQMGGLELQSATNASAVLVNRFSFPLRRLLVKDLQGRVWQVDEIPAGASVTAPPVSGNLVSKMLGSLYNDFRPVAESSTSRGRKSTNRVVRDLIAELNGKSSNGQELLLDGVFENELDRILKIEASLAPGQYVAISDVSPDVVAVADTELVDSVRYVIGTLVDAPENAGE